MTTVTLVISWLPIVSPWGRHSLVWCCCEIWCRHICSLQDALNTYVNHCLHVAPLYVQHVKLSDESSKVITRLLHACEIRTEWGHYEIDCTILCQVDLYVNKYGPSWMKNKGEFVVFAVQGLQKVISKHNTECVSVWSAEEKMSHCYLFDISVSIGIWTAG